MELRLYLSILRRWWPLVSLPALAIITVGLATYRQPATTYGATIRLTASLPPTSNGSGFDPAYSSWLTSEYIVGNLADWIKTGAFAQMVSDDLAAHDKTIPADVVHGSLASDYVRSQLVLFVNAGDADTAKAIADSAITVLRTRNAETFPQLGGQNATVTALDAPRVGASVPGLRAMLDLPIRVGLGLGVGLALAFIAHYFDPFLRDRRDVESLDLKVLGEIPKRK
jgi:capsular polysaccharide biosynthesis protein